METTKTGLIKPVVDVPGAQGCAMKGLSQTSQEPSVKPGWCSGEVVGGVSGVPCSNPASFSAFCFILVKGYQDPLIISLQSSIYFP